MPKPIKPKPHQVSKLVIIEVSKSTIRPKKKPSDQSDGFFLSLHRDINQLCLRFSWFLNPLFKNLMGLPH